ncbi:hypothetical protein EC968_009199, partial [Mortierella alpina]
MSQDDSFERRYELVRRKAQLKADAAYYKARMDYCSTLIDFLEQEEAEQHLTDIDIHARQPINEHQQQRQVVNSAEETRAPSIPDHPPVTVSNAQEDSQGVQENLRRRSPSPPPRNPSSQPMTTKRQSPSPSVEAEHNGGSGLLATDDPISVSQPPEKKRRPFYPFGLSKHAVAQRGRAATCGGCGEPVERGGWRFVHRVITDPETKFSVTTSYHSREACIQGFDAETMASARQMLAERNT